MSIFRFKKNENMKYLLFSALLTLTLSAAAQVGIGTSTPNAKAALDISSTTQGLLPPRMDSTARDAITSPPAGLVIYNTSIKAFQCYNGTAWYSTVHYIGEAYGGGIVFFVYDNGQHGLIAAQTDLTPPVPPGNGIPWSNHATTIRATGTTGNGIGSGAMNTATIIAIQIQDSPNGNFAARACADYSVTIGGITYGDWYLPSLYELSLLHQQRNVVGGFNSDEYWSSNEIYVIGNASSAKTYSFIATSPPYDNQYLKTATIVSVRAIRAF